MLGQIAHCDASQTLKRAGLARTSQRLAVLGRLIDAPGPLSVRDIFTATRGEQLDRVTIYRILSSLRKGGIIREIDTGSGIAHYEMACLHNPIHPHFHCRLCGCLTCLPALTLSQIWEWFARPFGSTIENVNVHITGVCGPCREHEDRNPVASQGVPQR
jgi:Fur family ferric uptake transcriptional regulator